MEPANTFRIMIATDVHLGCYGNDPVRSEDSFNSFEETLQNCVRHKADFLLLGGDLFHHSRPAQPVIFKCLRMLREYCLGSKPAEFEIVSDQKVNFAEQFFKFFVFFMFFQIYFYFLYLCCSCSFFCLFKWFLIHF